MRSTRILLYSLAVFLIGLYCYSKKVERNPHYGILFYRLGKNCSGRCSIAEQKDYYQKAVYHDPSLVDALYNLAIYADREGEDARALQLFKKVIDLSSSYHVAYFKVGVDFFLKNNLENAMQSFDEAIRCKYSYRDAFYYVGRIHEIRGEYKEANRFYRRILGQRNKYYYWVPLRLGISNYMSGDEKNALKYVYRLRELKRDDLADQLEQFMETGKYPEYLTRINLTHSIHPM